MHRSESGGVVAQARARLETLREGVAGGDGAAAALPAESATTVEELEVAGEELGIRTQKLAPDGAGEMPGHVPARAVPDLAAADPEEGERGGARLLASRRAGKLWLSGEADIATAGTLEQALAGLDPAGQAVVDLSGLEFLDARCADALFATAAERGPGRELVLRGASGIVRRVLDVLGASGRHGLQLE